MGRKNRWKILYVMVCLSGISPSMLPTTSLIFRFQVFIRMYIHVEVLYHWYNKDLYSLSKLQNRNENNILFISICFIFIKIIRQVINILFFPKIKSSWNSNPANCLFYILIISQFEDLITIKEESFLWLWIICFFLTEITA